jgi:hypothetical protein
MNTSLPVVIIYIIIQMRDLLLAPPSQGRNKKILLFYLKIEIMVACLYYTTKYSS